jgi:hypothetical protein
MSYERLIDDITKEKLLTHEENGEGSMTHLLILLKLHLKNLLRVDSLRGVNRRWNIAKSIMIGLTKPK